MVPRVTDETSPRDPSVVLSDLRKKNALIAKQLERRDSGKFKSVNDALTLQRLERERKQLLAELPPLHLIS